MAKILHNGKEYQIPDGATPEETLKSLAAAGMTELSNAELKPKGDDYTVHINTGIKG